MTGQQFPDLGEIRHGTNAVVTGHDPCQEVVHAMGGFENAQLQRKMRFLALVIIWTAVYANGV
jgi:hypothetical protein